MIEVLMRFSGRFVTGAPSLFLDSLGLKAALSSAAMDRLSRCALGDIRARATVEKVKLKPRLRRRFVAFRAWARIAIWTDKGTTDRLLPELLVPTFLRSCKDREQEKMPLYDSGLKEGEIGLDRRWLSVVVGTAQERKEGQ
jgi:hypothetical protein